MLAFPCANPEFKDQQIEAAARFNIRLVAQSDSGRGNFATRKSVRRILGAMEVSALIGSRTADFNTILESARISAGPCSKNNETSDLPCRLPNRFTLHDNLSMLTVFDCSSPH